MKAKKSFGQHFLNSEIITEEIAHGLQLTDRYDNVLEIGPGKGMLTKYLLKRDFNLKVVEADRDMVSFLGKNFPQLAGKIIAKDFLKTDLSEIFGGEQFGLIGNFPYNISSQIIFKMLEYKEFVPEMVGMFQKEVAERIVAQPGSKTYGVVSVLVQAYYDGKYLFTVDRMNFDPPPKVQSGVIQLVRKENMDLGCDYKMFRRVVKQAFGQRRKMLRNTMKIFFDETNEDEKALLQTDFFKLRPEKLSVEDYVKLVGMISSFR
ncbi:MAG TPA: 16S rRNA (adenine(1518)-N(6)/adenine(1519)-N(6))-dimethyltransferase RsmA [Phaeodactylibacter sp.]|nr:16S rRNA (adenine(1518)-N(6)/adenine(1519)-N(6))-dimethyltransferase RsmA [Phaeodactylibacter sp.]